MAVSAAQVTVGTTATSILAVGVAGTRVLVKNAGAASVFLGPASVTTGNGFELGTGDTVEVPLTAGAGLFGIVATGTEPVHVISA